MGWSKVEPGRKPLGWWFHKVLCEYGWAIRNKDGWKTYYAHLNRLCAYGYNLYGRKITREEQPGDK